MTLPSILIVEDDPTFRRIVTRFLQERCSDEVAVLDAVDGGFEGLVKAHTLGPDIVLIDLLLPDLHGLEVIARLRKTNPHVWIIAISQHSVEGYRQASLDAGADEFIPKVALNTALLPAIQRMGERRPPPQGIEGHSPELGPDPERGERDDTPGEMDPMVVPPGSAGVVEAERQTIA